MDAAQLRQTHEKLRETLEQYFGDVCADPRAKQSLEAQLNHFRQQSHAPQAAQYFLQHSTDKFVLWFSASLLEKLALEKWPTVDDASAASLRLVVLGALTAHASGDAAWAPMVVSKALALLCAIALHDFPHRYPGYFRDIHQLVSHPGTMVVGMGLLRYTLEEFPLSATPECAGRRRQAAALSTQRAAELAQFMRGHVGDFVPILQGVLSDPAREALAGEDALRSLEVILDTAPAAVAATIAASSKLLQLLFACVCASL
jgi:hypothetical protein